MGVAGSIFEPHPRNFGQKDIFRRSTNDITIIIRNFHYHKSYQKCTQAVCPGVEESLLKCPPKNSWSIDSLDKKSHFTVWVQKSNFQIIARVFKGACMVEMNLWKSFDCLFVFCWHLGRITKFTKEYSPPFVYRQGKYYLR